MSFFDINIIFCFSIYMFYFLQGNVPSKRIKKNESEVWWPFRVIYVFLEYNHKTSMVTVDFVLPLFECQVLFNMVVEVPRWSNAKMEASIKYHYSLIYFFFERIVFIVLDLCNRLVKRKYQGPCFDRYRPR